MNKIYEFLQRRKQPHSQNGLFMVVMAYVLSFALLVLGSDSIYNIRTRAAGINNENLKYAKEEIGIDIENNKFSDTLLLKAKYFSPNTEAPFFTYEDQQETAILVQQDNTEIVNIFEESKVEEYEQSKIEDNWLLGYGFSSSEYDQIIEQLEVVSNSIKKEIEYNETIESFSSNTETKKIKVKVSKEEIEMLERIVEAEATGEDIKGKILVANVVINRLMSEDFPNTVKGVIFHKIKGEYQFSPLGDKRYYSVSITEDTRAAVQRALEGEDHSQGALYFMARKITKAKNAKWFDRNLERLFQHGGHEFFKNK